MTPTHEKRTAVARRAQSKHLDALLPSAVEALGRKRASLQVLRDIDALLVDAGTNECKELQQSHHCEVRIR